MALIPPITLNTDRLVMTAGDTFEIRPGVIVGTHTAFSPVTAAAGGGSTLRNYGIIMGGNEILGTGVNIETVTGVTIHNAAGGLIFGGSTGIDLGSNTLFNTGTITGNNFGVRGDEGSRITNVGTIGGFDFDGVETAGELTNIGVIHGRFTVDLIGTGQTVINAGMIQGTGAAVILDGNATLHNTGVIHGEIRSEFNSNDRIINSGTIIGAIECRNGANLYDGRLGKLLGIAFLNEGNDTALGGAGNDTIDGGFGNDSLDGGAGTDTVIFWDGPPGLTVTVNLTLTGPQDTDAYGIDTLISIENVISQFGDDTLIGNAVANRFEASEGNDTLFGNAGNDTLLGEIGGDTLAGGAGSDVLTGGTGTDVFRFDTALAQAGIDKITDFVAVADTIQLKRSVFTALPLPLGQLNPNAFHTGLAAHDADDRIIYDSLTGKLFYDADGSGAAAKIHFATLTTKPAITAADFVVV